MNWIPHISTSLTQLTTEQRFSLIRKVIGIAFLIGILLSHHLWLSDRFFPLAPVMDWMPGFSSPIDAIFLLLLMLTLGVGVVWAKQKVFYVFLGLLILFLLQDQMRWQPWVYIYALFLIPFLHKKQTIAYFQIILIGVYIWSGIHKLNPNFIAFTFNDILKYLFEIRNPELIKSLEKAGYLVAAIEIGIGLVLAVPKLRKIGVFLAMGTHLFILLYLSPWGIDTNYIVYPWNIAMVILVFLVFFETENKLITWGEWSAKTRYLNTGAAILIWGMPFLNFLHQWDDYPSFSLYSDKAHRFFIAVEANELPKTDGRLRPYYVKIEGLSGGQIIELHKWAMGELNVPFYPETRLFKTVAQHFCELGISDEKMIFLEYERPLTANKFSSFSCKDLKSD